MEVILSHNNSDFDAIASQLAAWKLFPEAIPVLAVRLNRDVTEFLTLYRSGLPFVNWHDAKFKNLTRVILTDTHTVPSLKGLKPDTPISIIEHHPKARDLSENETWWGDELGAVTTLLVEEIQKRGMVLAPLEMTLLALGIYSDTGMLTYGQTTPRDVRAVAWLLEQGAHLDTIRKFLITPLDETQQALYTTLSQSAETRLLHGYPITLCSATVEKMVDGVNTVTRRISEMIEPAAIFTLVQDQRLIQLVARSAEDTINVGDIAARLGGGGHPRAAAAAIEGKSLDSVKQEIWDYLTQTVRPSITIRNLMSRGAQTASPDDAIRDILPRLRRIGHEGYPVVQHGKVLGLLTLRDADRALEHGLVEATVREVMQSGAISLSPRDSIATLEQTMLDSGWGQIPVVEQERLIGIVTRTDLLKHWVKVHPRSTTTNATVDLLTNAFAPSLATLIERIATEAQEQELGIYLVGGVVRDLLLKRLNHDIDIVVENDAIAFAHYLKATFGGGVSAFAPFGTAKWLLDQKVADQIGMSLDDLPRRVDFATARYEIYAYPTALPTVYNGSINLDLRRRDFSINAMAIQLSPKSNYGTLIDIYGGQHDLESKQVRVLHSLSLVDDPTRILRAIRFSTRYNFRIEERTEELIVNALPMLGRITGERLRNELTLLFQEANAWQGIRRIRELGVDRAMHPILMLSERVERDFEALTTISDDEHALLHWHIFLADVVVMEFEELSIRFLLAGQHSRQMQRTAELWQSGMLHQVNLRPSQVVELLEDSQPITRSALRFLGRNTPLAQTIDDYENHWQHLRPTTNGHTLTALGLKAGIQYQRILQTLRDAWLDEKITDAVGEQTLLTELLKDAIYDRP